MKRFHLSDYGATSGIGRYSQTSHKKIYAAWFNMLSRCYDKKMLLTHPSYQGCSVCHQWLNFQVFAEWYESQQAPDGWHVDKDIRKPGNRIYSPETCGLVPPEINQLFVRQKRRKDNGLPLGVSYKPRYTKNGVFTHNDICASCKDSAGKQVHLGYFQSTDDAALAYRQFKAVLIHSLAEKYRQLLAPVMYEALINYNL